MKSSTVMKFAMLSLFVFLCGSLTGAQTTVTVGPSGMYASPCAAFPHLADGDTVQVDANGGVPYHETACKITNNNLTIVGVNGRPVLDGTGLQTYYGLWRVDGHDDVIDNFEFRNAQPIVEGNAAGLRIESGTVASPDGGNITVQRSYIHDNGDGILTDNVGPPGYSNYAWYSANPFFTFQYDEFANNGDGSGQTHNMYISFGGNVDFTLQYSWSHDSYIGNVVKTRAQHNNILYNLVSDSVGASSYILDVPLGGSTYIVGNVLYKAAVTNSDANENMIIWRDGADNTVDDPVFGPPNEDLHFINNTVINASAVAGNGSSNNFVNMECFDTSTSACPAPNFGPALTTPAVIENNIFLGLPLQVTNQSAAYLAGNVTYANTAVTTASLATAGFVDPAHFDYHLTSGSPARGAGIYPPSDNTGATDPNALAKYEYVQPAGIVTRPTPTGSTMDAGAYSYPRVGTPPTLNLSYTETITAPNTGTITVTGLPTPPTGQYNYVAFYSENLSVIPEIPSVATSTGSVTTTFSTIVGSRPQVVVPIDIYADGAHATANVTVTPGPPTLYSITQDSEFSPGTTVHLLGPAPTGGTVVSLSSSNPAVLTIPATVTVPSGQVSAETGSLLGSLWSPTLSSETATITGNAGGVQQTLAGTFYSPGILPVTSYGTPGFACSPCSVVGGQQATYNFYTYQIPAPVGGATVTFTSSNTAVIPNQTAFIPAGQDGLPGSLVMLNTNSVSTNTSVTVTASYNTPSLASVPITVTPGGATAASIGVVSGSGQSATIGTPFTNPLVAVVETASGAPVSGATVTFAGANVSFPSGATAVTGSNGQAQVTAEPTAAGALTVTASVAGVGTPASFSETGTVVGGTLASVTASYSPATLVNLTGAATAPVVVSISVSDPSSVYAPATVTIPKGQTSASIGTLLAALWTPYGTNRSITITASYNGVIKTLTENWTSPFIHSFDCKTSCTVVGGQPQSFTFAAGGSGAPVGGGTVTFTSSNTAVIPNQTASIAAGAQAPTPYPIVLTTNAVASTTSVTVTASYNGSLGRQTITVNP